MTRSARAWALLALPLALAGCAGESAAAPAAAPSPAATVVAAAGPPATAVMVCSDDTRAKVQQLLGLPGAPHASATWADSVYACSYDLPMGSMTLSVRVLPGAAEAAARFAADQKSAVGAQSLAGLGQRAFGTPAGTASVVKDNQILTVDATRLPAVVGTGQLKRTDLADQVAAAVLDCWTGA